MRLLELDLERYGPFTGRKLAFRPDAKLHVVHGVNEAGKSSALAAIADLLFGIEARTAYDFLHDGKDMRIGARIAGRDGGTLHLRRRKGNKNTLIDIKDAALPDDALAPYLGGLTRDIFGRAFGLNAASLREGAQDMLSNNGDVGASLFAAAAGLKGLSDQRRKLDSEAAAIFMPRAAKDRTFYQALDRYEAARKAIRTGELKAGDWKDLNDNIDRLAQELDAVKARRSAAAMAQARLERLKRVAPVLRVIEDHLDRLSAFAGLPDPVADYAARLRQRIDAVTAAANAARSAADAVGKADGDLAGIAVDQDLLASVDDLQELLQATGEYAKGRHDLPGVHAQLDGFSAELAQLARRLGLADAEGLERAQPGDAALALARKLSGEVRTLSNDLDRLRGNLKIERDGLAELDRQRASRGALTDPKAWQERFAALAPALKLMEKRAEQAAKLAGETRDLTEAAARLRPAVTDLDALATTALPDATMMSRFRRQFDALKEDIRSEKQSLALAEQAAAELAEMLRGFTAGRPVASADVIAAARAARDAGWTALRATLFDEDGALDGGVLAGAVADYERDAAQADRLADEAASDAKRVADHALGTRRLAEEQDKAEQSQQRLATLQSKQTSLLDSWRAAWPGLLPGSPGDMEQWSVSVVTLLDRRRRLMGARDEIAARDEKIGEAMPMLRGLARDLGLDDAGDAAVLAQQVELRLRGLADNWNAARDLDTRRNDTAARMARLEIDEADAQARQADLTTRWQAAAAGIGLAAAATSEEADAALLAWAEIPGALRQRDDCRHRVAGIRRDIGAFEARAKEMVAALAPDLATLPADAAAKSLSARLADAQKAQTRKTEASRRLDEAERLAAEAEAALAQAQAALAETAKPLPTGGDLQVLAGRLAERDALRAELARHRQRLVDVADGHAEAALRDDLAGFDPDQASADIETLKQQIKTHDEDSHRIFAEHRDALRERTVREQGVGAEIAAQQKRGAEAELSELARDWAVTKLAAVLIARAVDHHRARQTDPLMLRAGDLFAALTEQSFVGVAQNFGDDDQPQLVGRRPSGDVVTIAHMSEGARDQLYLALRLAYLEDYAGHAEPAPFIADDIFASFDEARVARGLAALAEIGEAVQPIVFTHHRHVADIARDRLGADVLHLERG